MILEIATMVNLLQLHIAWVVDTRQVQVLILGLWWN